MLQLINVCPKEFKKAVYPHYVELFPISERKPFIMIKRAYNKGILKIIKVMHDDVLVGFLITNITKDASYLQLDYFAILKEYQNKGYGTKALELLKENSKEYKGIFIEVDKLGLGTSDEENKIRMRRIKFYENIGAYKLNYDINLFNVIFTPYIIPILDNVENEYKIMEEIYNIYLAVYGKKITKRKVKVIKV